jgi:hypothetical protein
MFGIGDIAKNAVFRRLRNGYYYKILDIDWNGFLCTVDFKVIQNYRKIVDPGEVEELNDVIINDILSFDYFRKMKVDNYESDPYLINISENVYELYFVTEERKLHPIIGLHKYCNGKEIKVLSGDLAGKTGIYQARLNDIAERGYIEVILIDNTQYDLQGSKFSFTDEDIQVCWESITESA